MLPKKINKKFLVRLFILLIGVAFSSCNSGNPADVPPAFIQFVSAPNENSVLSSNDILFMWKGSDEDFLFRYRLVSIDNEYDLDYIDWTNYSSLTEIEFNDLDEGKYRFELEGKSMGFVGSPLTRIFYVDAVKGPSLSFNKISTRSKVGVTDSVNIWMEDVNNLSACRFVISFNPKVINLVSVGNGKFILDNNFNQIIVPDFTNPNVISEANRTGKIEINSAVLMTLLTYPNNFISGSGKLVNLRFVGIAKGTSPLEFSTIELYRADGTLISNGVSGTGIYKIE